MRSESSFRFPTSTMFLVAGFDPATPRRSRRIARLDFDDARRSRRAARWRFFARDRMQARRPAQSRGGRARRAASGAERHGRDDGRHDGVLAARVVQLPPWTTRAAPARRLVRPALRRRSSSASRTRSPPCRSRRTTTCTSGTARRTSSTAASSRAPSTFQPNTDIRPRHMDEITVGLEHQVGVAAGVAVRYVHRTWADFIDDVIGFNADGSVSRVVQNVRTRTRTYRGIEVSFDKRLSRSAGRRRGATPTRRRAATTSATTSRRSATSSTRPASSRSIPALGDAAGRLPVPRRPDEPPGHAALRSAARDQVQRRVRVAPRRR